MSQMCLPFCPVGTCCDLPVVLAQAPSRVHSEPVINQVHKAGQHKEANYFPAGCNRLNDSNDSERPRTQYMCALCSWDLEKSADSTQRSPACQSFAVDGQVDPHKRQLKSYKHIERSERKALAKV